MNLLVILIVLLLLFGGVGTLPTWHYSQDWGRGPTSLIWVLLVVVVVVSLLKRV